MKFLIKILLTIGLLINCFLLVVWEFIKYYICNSSKVNLSININLLNLKYENLIKHLWNCK